MKGMPRLNIGQHEKFYEYLRSLSDGSTKRPGTIAKLISDANSTGSGVAQVNQANWSTAEEVVIQLQPSPKLCSTLLPDEKTVAAIEEDDDLGASDPYPLPNFYKDMFEVVGGNIQLRKLSQADRRKFRKMRLADYMTQKCF